MKDVLAEKKYKKLSSLVRTTVVLMALSGFILSLHACQFIQAPTLAAYSGGTLVVLIALGMILELLMRPLRKKLHIINKTSQSSGENWVVDPVYGPPDNH